VLDGPTVLFLSGFIGRGSPFVCADAFLDVDMVAVSNDAVADFAVEAADDNASGASTDDADDDAPDDDWFAVAPVSAANDAVEAADDNTSGAIAGTSGVAPTDASAAFPAAFPDDDAVADSAVEAADDNASGAIAGTSGVADDSDDAAGAAVPAVSAAFPAAFPDDDAAADDAVEAAFPAAFPDADDDADDSDDSDDAGTGVADDSDDAGAGVADDSDAGDEDIGDTLRGDIDFEGYILFVDSDGYALKCKLLLKNLSINLLNDDILILLEVMIYIIYLLK
jgi:hypothetical protein